MVELAQETSSQRAKRKYVERHPERVNASKQAWFDKNPKYLEGYYVTHRVIYLVKQARRRALKSGVPFDLSPADLIIPDVCPVLGIAIRLDARGGFNPHSPSLDRVLPARGYVLSNVRVISNRANLLKRDATVEELRAVLAYVERELG